MVQWWYLSCFCCLRSLMKDSSVSSSGKPVFPVICVTVDCRWLLLTALYSCHRVQSSFLCNQAQFLMCAVFNHKEHKKKILNNAIFLFRYHYYHLWLYNWIHWSTGTAVTMYFNNIIMSNSLMQRIYYIMLLYLEVICLFCTYFLLQGDCCTQNVNCEK